MTPEQNRMPTPKCSGASRASSREMPGLRLTGRRRAACGDSTPPCVKRCSALVDAKFLFKTRDGAFMRWNTPPPSRRRFAAQIRGSDA